MLEHLLRPGTIGRLVLPHRVVMGSMHLGLESRPDGGRALAAFYAARARGGAALIVTGGSAVSTVGAGGRNYSFVNDPQEHDRLALVARAVHEAGGLVALQLFHAGRYAFTSSFGLQPVAPSAVPSRFSPDAPRALSADEVAETVADFASGARTARRLGFDAVELMGSEGYLLNQFTSPLTNRRDDEWGGDAGRRSRFPLEVIRACRVAAGEAFPVIYRMSGADLMPGSATPAEVLDLARALAAAGVAAINVGVGWHESRVPTVQAVVPTGVWADCAAAVKQAVAGTPVIASNRVNRLAQAEEIVRSGAADFVSLARPFLADPDIVAKSRAGSTGSVNICIACNQACIDQSLVDEPVSCMVNPVAGRELALAPVTASSTARFAVVGAGPAGLAAARTLALGGAKVTLFEAEGELGGQFRMARLVPGKADYAETVRYYAGELDRLGVQVRLGRAVGPDDAELLTELDGVVLATGVRPREVDLPGRHLAHVLTYAEAFAAPQRVGSRVAVIGGGGVAVDFAHLVTQPLSQPGGIPAKAWFRAEYGLSGSDRLHTGMPPARQVTLLRRGGRIGEGIGRSTRWVLVDELRRRGVAMRTGVTYQRIVPQGVELAGSGGPELVEADSVVLAAGQDSHDPLSADLVRRGARCRVVGGARSAIGVNAVRAFEEGMAAARSLIVGGLEGPDVDTAAVTPRRPGSASPASRGAHRRA